MEEVIDPPISAPKIETYDSIDTSLSNAISSVGSPTGSLNKEDWKKTAKMLIIMAAAVMLTDASSYLSHHSTDYIWAPLATIAISGVLKLIYQFFKNNQI